MLSTHLTAPCPRQVTAIHMRSSTDTEVKEFSRSYFAAGAFLS